MAINRASISKQLLPGLNAIFGLEYGSIDEEHMNRVFCASSENMKELPDCSIHLMITSPPISISAFMPANADMRAR